MTLYFYRNLHIYEKYNYVGVILLGASQYRDANNLKIICVSSMISIHRLSGPQNDVISKCAIDFKLQEIQKRG